MKYGERFQELRKKLWKGRRVIDLARALGADHPQVVHGIEQRWRVPALSTIENHAQALGCAPWELLKGVRTEFDEARSCNDLPPKQAAAAWGELVKRYQETKSTTRTTKSRTRASPRGRTAVR